MVSTKLITVLLLGLASGNAAGSYVNDYVSDYPNLAVRGSGRVSASGVPVSSVSKYSGSIYHSIRTISDGKDESGLNTDGGNSTGYSEGDSGSYGDVSGSGLGSGSGEGSGSDNDLPDFEEFDADDNGCISETEFNSVKNDEAIDAEFAPIAAAFGSNGCIYQWGYNDAVEIVTMFQEELDYNGDGCLSRPEYAANPAETYTFDQIDTLSGSADECISLDDVFRFVVSMRIDTLFSSTDTDGNGCVTPGEFNQSAGPDGPAFEEVARWDNNATCISKEDLNQFMNSQQQDITGGGDACEEDIYGRECFTECDMKTTCSGHGRCLGWDGSCKCFAGWANYDCSVDVSGSGLGSGSGEGSGSGGDACEENIYGGGCVIECDMKTTCSGHGRCLGWDGSCKCFAGWANYDCSVDVSGSGLGSGSGEGSGSDNDLPDFEEFDADDNGCISETEFNSVKNDEAIDAEFAPIAAAFGSNGCIYQWGYNDAVEIVTMFQEELDYNGDGCLSRPEYAANPAETYTFDQIDTLSGSADECISLDDVFRFVVSMRIDTLFSSTDTDGNGCVTPGEFNQSAGPDGPAFEEVARWDNNATCISKEDLNQFMNSQQQDITGGGDACEEDIYGRECFTECDMKTTCSGHGRCLGWDGSCKCFAGWANYDCSVDVSGSGLGSGSGEGSGSGGDACEENIYGGGCVIECDMKTTCSGHGRCLGWDGSCKCFAGWANYDCSVDVSGSGLGSGSGETSGSGGDACEENIYGGGCVIECDMKTTCSGHGRCLGWDGSCKCFAGWANYDCSVDVSGSGLGSGSGETSGSGGDACEENIYGGGCVIECDMKTTCSGHGRCLGWDGSCKCFAGWANYDCSVDVSGSGLGSGSGEGSGSGGDACEENIYGGGCVIECDMKTTCSGHGLCLGWDGSCKCFAGWVNYNCSVERFLPTEVQELTSMEFEGGVTVMWQAPVDTGFGDVEYVVETSVCPDFLDTEACVYHLQVINETSVHLGLDTLKKEAEIYHIRIKARNVIGVGPGVAIQQQFKMTVMELRVEQPGMHLQLSWHYSVLDQQELKFVVRVNSSDGSMVKEIVYLAADVRCTESDCEEGMHDAEVPITLPEGPEADRHSVTVTLKNGDGDQGLPVEAGVYVIGPPSTVAPLLITEVSLSKWAYKWTHPINFWKGEASHPAVYEIEVRCGVGSMALLYKVTSSVKSGIVRGDLVAEWQSGVTTRELKLTPDNRVMRVSAGSSSELVCYPGDYVNFSVVARNRLFEGPASSATKRVLAPPTQVQELTSWEYEGGVTVTWQAPVDTGFGDGSAAVEYVVETSVCPDFSDTEACVYHSQVTLGLNTNLTRLVLMVTGEVYHIRVSAQNAISTGSYRQTKQSFMIIPMILSPAVSRLKPLRVTSAGSFVHVWADGSDRRLDGTLQVSLFGLQIHDTGKDLQAHLVFSGAVSSHALTVLSFQIAEEGILFISLHLPSFSLQDFQCPHDVCAATIFISSRLSPNRKASLYIEYFAYAHPEILYVLPHAGSEYGGTRVNVQVRDFLGAETRHGAGLPSFSDSLLEGIRTTVRTACGNKTSSPADVVSKFLPKSGAYELEFRVPQSPCGAQVSHLRFEMFKSDCENSSCSWQPDMKGSASFKYRGPGILDVSPASGMINRGNKRTTITIVLENVGTINGAWHVTLGGFNCTLKGEPVYLQTDDSDLVRLQILSPELPRDSASLQQLVVTMSSSLSFVHLWEYLQPPEPEIDSASFQVNGNLRDPLWLKKTIITSSAQNPKIEFIISSLSSVYGIDFSSLQVWFNESRNRVMNEMFESVGVDVKLSFNLDIRGMPEGLYNMTIHIILNEKVVQVLEAPGHVEIRDMSIPTLIPGAVAPSEGPAFGGTFVLLGVSGASQLNGKSLLFSVIRQAGASYHEVVGELLGRAISLDSWGTDNNEYLAVMKMSASLKQGSKQLITEYQDIVRMVDDVTPSDESGAFLVVQMPQINVSGPVVGVITTGDNSARISFDFNYVATPSHTAKVTKARTLLGSASGNMDGGYDISITLSNFVITYNILDLVIEFGPNQGIITQIDQSNSLLTQIKALVPSGDSGTVLVSIYHRNHPENEATFEFEYIDTRFPVVEQVSPIQVYSDGGHEIQVDIAKFPGNTKAEDVTIAMQDAASGQPLGASFKPVTVGALEQSEDGYARLRFSFLTLARDGNQHALVRVILSVRGKQVNFELSYIATPSGAPVISKVNPSVADCTDLSQKVIVHLNNTRMVRDPSVLHLAFGNVTLGNDQKVSVMSTMLETRVSFFMPGLMEHIVGPVPLQVQSGEVSAAFTTIHCKDTRMAQLLYVLPASGFAGEEVTVTIGIRNFGPATQDGLHISSRSSSVSTSVLAINLLGDVTEVQLQLKAVSPSISFATVASCKEERLCSEKNVSFSFEFLDPLAIRAEEFIPVQEYTYGGTIMRIKVRNLPMNISTSDIMMEFVELGNQSVIAIDHSKSDAVMKVKIPSSTSAATVAIKMYLISLNLVLDFIDPFVYIPAPAPSVTRIVPSSASIQTSTRVRITLQNFPTVSTTADIKVRLQWGSTAISALVISTSSKSASTRAVQELDVDVDTPVGETVREGAPDVIIYHQMFGETNAAISQGGFLMIDSSSPQIKGLRSGSAMGTSKVRLPMSASSEVIAIVENVPRPTDISPSAYVVQIGDNVLDISSIDVAYSRQAKVIFTTLPSSSTRDQYCIIAFGKSCSSACCEDMSCSTRCPDVKTTCFMLQYYDDTLPVLTIKSDVSGPEIGGDILTLQIANFPILSSSSDVLVSYILRNSMEFIDGISVEYSNAESGAGLMIVTPAFGDIIVDQDIEFRVIPKANPSRSVSFTYTVLAVYPEIKSLTPSTGLATGGQTVLVEILYFAYPVDVRIMFGKTALPDSTIQVLSMSNRHSTKIRFETPETEPGEYEVVIKPKICSQACPDAVRITMTQIDPSIPEIVPPIPKGASFQKLKMPPIYLMNVPVDSHTFVIHFEGSEVSAEVSVSPGSIQNTKLSGVKVLLADTPQGIDRPEAFMVSVSFTQAGIVKQSAPVSFNFYNGFVPRVADVQPLTVPTSGLIAGRKLLFLSEVSITCMNFPQNLAAPDGFFVVLSPASDLATVLEVRQEVTCPPHVADCNRTLLVLQTPAVLSPGLQEVQVMERVPGRAPKQVFVTNIEYASPCDFDRFCADMGLVTNFKLLVDKPQISCSAAYCIDLALVGNPVIVRVSPSEGLKSGGIEVKVDILNLPAFAINDVMVKVKSKTSAQIAKILSLSQTYSSSLISSQGELIFVAPQFNAMDEFATVEIAAMVAGQEKRVSFPFEYLPVIIGPAVVADHSPSSVFDGEPLKVRVQITNFPRLSFPYSSHDVIIMVSGVKVATSNVLILSSDRYSTTLTFTSAYTAESGQIPILLGSRSAGLGSLRLLEISVRDCPGPRIASSYPPLNAGIAGNAPVPFSTRIKFLPPDLILAPNFFSVQLTMTSSHYAVEMKNVRRLMEADCAYAYCSLIEFQFLIPALSDHDSGLGGTGNITISSSTGAVTLSAELVFSPSQAPSVEVIMPSSLLLTQREDVRIFLKSYPTAMCGISSSCASDAQGLTLQFDSNNLQSPDVLLLDSRGMLIVSFAAPVSERAGKETGRMILANNPSLEFALMYEMPDAEVRPKDGSSLGNERITITARGWWGNGERLQALPSRDSFSIFIGEVMLEASNIVSIQANALDLVVVVRTPVSKVAGIVACRIGAALVLEDELGTAINQVQKESRFDFEYFNNPEIMSVVPASATLTGKTTSEDGRSVLLKIKNFPALTQAKEFLVTIGTHTCGALATCDITAIKSSETKDGKVLFVRVSVPPATAPGKVAIRVEPSSNSADRRFKSVDAQILYYRPVPVISSMRWCQTCAEKARTCIVMGSCGDGSEPLDNLIPMSGGGVVTLQMEDPPDFEFLESNGKSEAMIMLSLGANSYGEFSRVAYGNGETKDGKVEKSDLVALEFAIPALSSPEGDQAVLSILPAGALSSSSASRVFAFFDNSVSVQCLEGCGSAATGMGHVVVAVTNLPLDLASAAVGQVDATIGLFNALSVEFYETSICTTDSICLRLGVPGCNSCKFARGLSEVLLSVSLKGDRMRGSETRFSYFSAPSIESASFDPIGTSIIVSFDQSTDRGNVEPGNSDCGSILEEKILPLLATFAKDATCVWEGDDILNIFLGPGASILPNDPIAIRDGTLRSKNSVSGPCTSRFPLSAPDFAIAPTVTVSGTNEIDPCSDLELRAIAASPRPLIFAWSCRNDDTLNEVLRSVTTSVVYFNAGTQEMQAMDKTYEIAVVAIDFLGVSSATVVFPVLKKGSPAPLLSFVPPTLSMFQDESSLVKVVATFSKCPIEKGKLMFSWSLMSGQLGSTVDPEIFSVSGSQLFVPSGVLQAGHTYTLGVNAYMDNDPTKTTKGAYQILVKYKPLTAMIKGGSSISASTTRSLFLDSSGSADPDFAGEKDAGLQFAWSCSIQNGKSADICRTKDGAKLTMPSTAVVELSANTLDNMYPTSGDPYVFTVTVEKGSKIPVTFSMPVSLTEAAIPEVSIEAGSGERRLDGRIRLNPADQLIVFGECSVIRDDLAIDLTTTWSFEPAIDAGVYEIISEKGSTVVSRKRETLVVGADTGAFAPGSLYLVKLTCTDFTGESTTAKISLAINVPPRGNPCQICRLAGAACAADQPRSGQPIFDTFRFSCLSWADEDSPLEYQFAYSGFFGGEFTEVLLDWGSSSVVDMIFPPGDINVKARVRDSFGASTAWMDLGQVHVGKEPEKSSRRSMLQSVDQWGQAEQTLRDTIDLSDFTKINQLVGALAIEVDTRVASSDDTNAVALLKKKLLLQVLRTAVASAIKTEGYVCESSAIAAVASSNIDHVGVSSVLQLAGIIADLSASGEVQSLSSGCAQNFLALIASGLDSNFKNRTCLETGHVDSDQQAYIKPFVSHADRSLAHILRKTSSKLLPGQSLLLNSNSSTTYSYSVSKMSTAARIEGLMLFRGASHDKYSYSMPEEVRQDPQVASESAVSVLFGAFAHPPALDGINPVSSIITLSLADNSGRMIPVHNLSTAVNITIPLSAKGLCKGEESAWAGETRCLYFDTHSNSYKRDGCTAHRTSDTAVTCMCMHLTSFVVEPVFPQDTVTDTVCPRGTYLELGESRICSPCVPGTYSNATDMTSCLQCGTGKYSGNEASNCTECEAGTFSAVTGSATCIGCEAGKYSSETGASACRKCPAGKYLNSEGNDNETDCVACVGGNVTSLPGSTCILNCSCLPGFVGSPASGIGCTVTDTACPRGTYLELGESRICSPCVPGTYSNATDMTSCLQCGTGKYSGNEASNCTECGAGTFSAVTGSATCIGCEAGKFSDDVGASVASTCVDCGAGKYSAADASTICTNCTAGTYSNASGIAHAASCLQCPDNSGSPSGSTLADKCVCNEGYQGPNGGVCLLYVTLTNVDIIYSSIDPGASNKLVVKFKANLEIGAGATIEISGFVGTGTTSGTLMIIIDVEGDHITSGTGRWNQDLGVLSFTTSLAASKDSSISIGFTLQNPATAQNAPIPKLTVVWPSGLNVSQTVGANKAFTVCGAGYFGDGCSQRCYGTVLGRACVCPEDYFGHDCQVFARPSAESVPAVAVKPGEPKTLKNDAGLGVDIPAGALTSGATIEVKVYDVSVTISNDQPGNPISSAGPLGVFLPHGLQFSQPVSLVLKYDPRKIPSGNAVYVYYYNESALPPVWEKMEGNIVGPGLVETKTTHFSTFGAMSTKSLEPLPPADSQTKPVDIVPDPRPDDSSRTANDSSRTANYNPTTIIVIVVCVVVTIFILAAMVWIRRRSALSGTALFPGDENQQRVPKPEASAQGPSSFTQDPFNPPPSTASDTGFVVDYFDLRRRSALSGTALFPGDENQQRVPKPEASAQGPSSFTQDPFKISVQQPTFVFSASLQVMPPSTNSSEHPLPSFVGPTQSIWMPGSPQTASLLPVDET